MEFSQRPAHPTIPGAHSYMGVPPAHYQQHTADPQPLYSAYAQQQQQQQQQQRPGSAVPAADAYPVAPRRLPSVSELLTPQDAAGSNSVQVAARTQRDTMPYTTQVMQVDRTQQFGSYPEPQQVFAIDVPGARAIQQQQMTTEYLSYHRDSESASSVSSQGTLMDSRVSPIHHTYKRTSIYQQHQQQSQHQQYVQQPFASTPAAEADRNMCEEDVFTAASILMSLRTCKMPC